MTELDVARAIASGALSSPQQFGGSTLAAIRISGTGASERPALNEKVWRDPAIWLSPETISRCSGLPVILDHPDRSTLTAAEYEARSIGAILLAYIARRDGVENTEGPDLWGIARLFIDDDLLAALPDLSTSPAVGFSGNDGNQMIALPDGSECLVEGNPSLLDHIAILTESPGVWDKGGTKSGIRTDSTGERKMPTENETEDHRKEREEKERADAAEGTNIDKVLKYLDGMSTMMDAFGKRMDAMEMADKARKDAMEGQKGETAETAADRARKDAAEEGERADAQARCDAAAQAWGERAAPPMMGEKPLAYRIRLARRFQKYSDAFANVDLHGVADAAAFAAIETKIYADATEAAKRPDRFVEDGRMIERTRVDAVTGHRITEFFGKRTFIHGLKRPSQRVTAFNVPNMQAPAR